MNAAPPDRPVTEGVPSLEVRWIFSGQLETAVAGWFGRFPAETESRQDTYLLDPDLPGLSVKIRAGRALEVKAYRGSPGILDLAGRAHVRLQSWQKWSFPFGLPGRDGGPPAGWRPVYKRRRVSRFSLAGERIVAGPGGVVPELACAVELTEIRARGKAWWSLGFEATGPAGLLRGELEATAAVVFTQALPGDLEPGINDSSSYAEWLARSCALLLTPRPERCGCLLHFALLEDAAADHAGGIGDVGANAQGPRSRRFPGNRKQDDNAVYAQAGASR